VLSQIAPDGAATGADRDAAVTATLLAASGGEYVGVRSKERLGVLQALLHVVCTSAAFREQLQVMQAAAGAAAAEQVGWGWAGQGSHPCGMMAGRNASAARCKAHTTPPTT
jgi:hypothetical protein